ncbi:MAG: hypothetical protein ACOC3Z_02155 [Nanoarchaeota archaeon]
MIENKTKKAKELKNIIKDFPEDDIIQMKKRTLLSEWKDELQFLERNKDTRICLLMAKGTKGLSGLLYEFQIRMDDIKKAIEVLEK